MNESDIVINSCTLSPAQAMALRVAASNMASEMKDPEMRALVGEELADGYHARLCEVLAIMLSPLPLRSGL